MERHKFAKRPKVAAALKVTVTLFPLPGLLLYLWHGVTGIVKAEEARRFMAKAN